jgi:hypothetical protein
VKDIAARRSVLSNRIKSAPEKENNDASGILRLFDYFELTVLLRPSAPKTIFLRPAHPFSLAINFSSGGRCVFINM